MLAGKLHTGGEVAPSQKLLSPVLRIALLLGIIVHLAGFLIFRVISNPLPAREPTATFVQYVSPHSLLVGAELEEQAVLFDSAPLFVPSPWNAAHNLLPPSRDRGLLRFPSYLPEMDLSSTSLLPASLPVGQTYSVQEPADLLVLRYWDLFRDITQERSTPVELADTGVFAEVRSLKGEVLRTLPANVESLSMIATQPVSYFLRVEAGGRVLGRPTLSDSSGDAAFDASAYNWLVESGVAAGLPAGLFEIRIYP